MSANPAQTLYSFRRPYPASYVRGQANPATLPAYRDGALVAPTEAGSTYSLLPPGSDTAIVDAEAITVTGSIATYALSASELSATAELSARYLERWSLIMPDGTTRVQEYEIIVCRRAIAPVLTDADLTGYFANLAAHRNSNVDSFQAYIDESWREILAWLIARNLYPARIMNPEALRPVHKALAGRAIYEDFAKGQPGRGNYLELAERQDKRLEAAWAELRLLLDNDDSGRADDADAPAAQGIVYPRTARQAVSAGPSGRWW